MIRLGFREMSSRRTLLPVLGGEGDAIGVLAVEKFTAAHVTRLTEVDTNDPILAPRIEPALRKGRVGPDLKW